MKPALLALALSTTALASGLADHGEDLFEREKFDYSVHGFFRLRGDWLNNLDLDRGTTPSGRPLFAVPLGDPTGQSLFVADMKLRTDLALYAPFAAAAVKLRIDVLDDLVLGSTPSLSPGTGSSPTPAASATQLPSTLFRLKRAYGEILTPFGYLAAGRMGNMWGLGMMANGGDCLDCNRGDQADRVAFVTSLAQHLWAVAYDFSAVGPLQTRRDGQRQVILDPSTDVQSVSFALMNVKDDHTRRRRRLAGKWTVEYGVLASYRWQNNDVPAAYLPVATDAALTPASVMFRGYQAGVVDGWLRVQAPQFKLEAEVAVLGATVAQASLLPGVLLRDRVTSLQVGGALETTLGAPDSVLQGGLNLGAASGDPAPGFGAFPQGSTAPQAGELDGPQLELPRDTRIDNFRFHSDYRVDRILFAELVGTVTDAWYVRPWARTRLLEFRSYQLALNVDGTFSRAIYASSTPGNDAGLGMELHAALTWASKDGFDVLAEYAVLFPFAGFDNPAQGLTARPAQLGRVRLAWRF
ncbi:MAG: TIGR04551 family protein [Myxococcota bacterium]